MLADQRLVCSGHPVQLLSGFVMLLLLLWLTHTHMRAPVRVPQVWQVAARTHILLASQLDLHSYLQIAADLMARARV